MERIYIEETQFEEKDFTVDALADANYENCCFVNCNFSNGNLSNLNFSECKFNSCNLSMAKIGNTAFRATKFIGCKLLGMHFENCNDFIFTVDFKDCILNLSSFYKLKLKKIIFNNSILQEVDFTEADLTGSVFDNCDLTGAIFDNTIIEKADFRTSYNYSINPENNRIKKAKFSITGIAGLLDKYDIEVE